MSPLRTIVEGAANAHHRFRPRRTQLAGSRRPRHRGGPGLLRRTAGLVLRVGRSRSGRIRLFHPRPGDRRRPPAAPPAAGPRSAWPPYFQTSDADATARSVEQAGGHVRAAPFDVFDEGRMGQFTDPGGARFAVWQPGKTAGLEAVTEPGSLCWTELHSPAPAVARAFYPT